MEEPLFTDFRPSAFALRLEMCSPFDVRHSTDEIILLSLMGEPKAFGAHAGRGARVGPDAEISSVKQGRFFVSTKGSTSPSIPLTRAEQEVQSAAERLNSQIEDAIAAVAGRQTPGGVDELEASADRLERAARDLSVALRELVDERREKDKL
jgi:hypothetical protein